jgi:hypothetical protein
MMWPAKKSFHKHDKLVVAFFNEVRTALSSSVAIAMGLLVSELSKEPLAVAIALGLLVSELSKEPWKGRVIRHGRRWPP